MVIRVITFEGCPNCQATRDLVEKTVQQMHVNASIEDIQIANEEEARRYRFLGSPTIQIDGQDIEADRRDDRASFSCRVYRTRNGITGVPPTDLLVEAINRVQRNPT
jgi:glutaredoxin